MQYDAMMQIAHDIIKKSLVKKSKKSITFATIKIWVDSFREYACPKFPFTFKIF